MEDELDEKEIKEKKNWGRIIGNLALFSVIFLCVRAISTYVFHNEFISQKTNVLNSPDFWTRHVTNIVILLILFAILYFTRIYELINNFIGGIFSDREEIKRYQKTKLIIWIIIIVLLYFFVVPKAIRVTNSVGSFAINIGSLFIHLIPTFLISIALYFAILFGIKHWKKQKLNENMALDLEKETNVKEINIENIAIENQNLDSKEKDRKEEDSSDI